MTITGPVDGFRRELLPQEPTIRSDQTADTFNLNLPFQRKGRQLETEFNYHWPMIQSVVPM